MPPPPEDGRAHSADEQPAQKPFAPDFDDQYHRVTLDPPPGPRDHAFACHTRTWHAPPGAPEGGRTLFLIPGLGHNFDFFTPLAARLLDPAAGVGHVSRVVAVDLPGHGGSAMAPNVRFGALTLRHYVLALRQVMRDLATGHGLRLDVVAGHSLGGLLAMMVEQELAERGSSMAERYGARGVVLLSPTIPDSTDGTDLEWYLAEGGREEGAACPALLMLSPYLTTSLRYTVFLHAAAEDYLHNFFGVRKGGRKEVEAGAPDLTAARTLVGIESYAACSEMCGLDLRTGDRFGRPLVDRGRFAAYAYGHVAFSGDTLLRVAEQEALYEYLRDGADAAWELFEHEDASHNSPYSHPEATLGVFGRVLAEVEGRAGAAGAEAAT